MIDGVEVKKLRVISDERGRLMEILRCDDKIFKKFGQVYMTTVRPGVVKAWHYHNLQDDFFCCVSGKIRVALFDARKNSKTFGKVQEFTIGPDNPLLIKIPKGVYHGFKGVAKVESIVINTPTMAYNYNKPDEYRVDAFENDIPYNWRK